MNGQIYLLKLKIKLIIILDFERNSVVASAFAQEQTQAPVGFHPGVSFDDKLHSRHDNHSFSLSGPDSESPFEIMRIFTEAGGDASKASVGHMSSN